jgi:hypothetical protein
MPPFEETTNRRAGYLASLLNIPPLIFRFQFNPESITDKKSFSYQEANGFGEWALDHAKAATDIPSTVIGLVTDVKELGARLTGTKPLEARGGEPRTISMDFVLDARRAGPKDGNSHYDGSIAPDLAVLRAFLYPPYDLIDLTKLLVSEFKDVPCFIKPPECSLSYGGISLTCVMTDLNIRVTAFDQKTDPLRAEVSVTLKEQSQSVSHVVDFVKRNVHTFLAPFRENWQEDLLVTSGIQGVIDLF